MYIYEIIFLLHIKPLCQLSLVNIFKHKRSAHSRSVLLSNMIYVLFMCVAQLRVGFVCAQNETNLGQAHSPCLRIMVKLITGQCPYTRHQGNVYRSLRSCRQRRSIDPKYSMTFATTLSQTPLFTHLSWSK